MRYQKLVLLYFCLNFYFILILLKIHQKQFDTNYIKTNLIEIQKFWQDKYKKK